MRTRFTMGLLCGAVLLAAQSNQPKPKSQKEVEAILAMQDAKDPDSRVAAVENLLTKFADTEFKAIALYAAAVSEQQKNDYEKTVIYAERALEADPKNYGSMLLLAQTIANHTREFDLDREEKLGKAEKYARDAQEVLKTAPKPRPNLTDEQWEVGKKDLVAQSHEALGIASMARKGADVAITEFRASIEGASTPDPATMVRLGDAYVLARKFDEAVAELDKVLAMADLHPTVKQIAQAKRAEALRKKGLPVEVKQP